MFKKLKERIVQFAKEGMFHIFGSGVLAKVGGIISSVVVIRHLPKTEYGYFVDADNLYAYTAIFVGLGLSTAIIQFCSERIADERKNAIYRYSLKVGMLGNVLLGIIILGLAALKYFSGSTQAGMYLAMMCLLPFFAYIDQYHQIILRVKRENQKFSRTNMIYTAAHVGGNIVMTMLWGVPGLVTSQYLGHGIAAIYSALVLKKEHFYGTMRCNTLELSRTERKEYLSYGLVCTITNFTSTVLVLLDVTCLGLVLSDSAVLADYKVAATIPSALVFVPQCLMTFFYPKVVESFSNGKQAGKAHLKQVVKIFALVNGFIYVCLALAAPLIIRIMFGEKYMNIVPIFQILGLNYLAYSFRNVTGNAIAIMKRVKVNLLFAVLSGVLNICLNLLLIPWIGSIGAAVATLVVTIFITILNVGFLTKTLKEK